MPRHGYCWHRPRRLCGRPQPPRRPPSPRIWPRPTAEWSRAADALGSFQALPDADLFETSSTAARAGEARHPPRAPVRGPRGGCHGWCRAPSGGPCGRPSRRGRGGVLLLDRDRRALEQTATDVGGLAIATDLTRPDSVAGAFDRIVRTFGGLDVLVSTQASPMPAPFADVDEATLRAEFRGELLRASTRGAGALARVSGRRASAGACSSTSQAGGVPGTETWRLQHRQGGDAGPDDASMPWSAAAEGIRANAVNPDRIRSGILDDAHDQGTRQGAELSVEDYMAGNTCWRGSTGRRTLPRPSSCSRARSGRQPRG